MHLPRAHLAFLALILTVVPDLKTIAKASNAQGPPPPASYPLSLPLCAQPALKSMIRASGCQPNDAECACANPKFIPDLLRTIKDDCGPTDQAAVKSFGTTYCGQPGPTALRTSTSTVSQTDSRVGHTRMTKTKTTESASKTDSKPSRTASKTNTMHGTGKPMNGTSSGGVAEMAPTGAALAAGLAGMAWVFAEL